MLVDVRLSQGPLAVNPSQHRIVPSSLFLLFWDQITSHAVCRHTKQQLLAGVKESSNVMMTLSNCSPLSNPSLWLLLCPSLPLQLSSSLALSLCGGVLRVSEERERAGAVGNKCLIIRLIIIPGGCESGRWRKGGEKTHRHYLNHTSKKGHHICINEHIRYVLDKQTWD